MTSILGVNSRMEYGFCMNKSDLRLTILGMLEQKLAIAYSSVQRAIESATDEETVPEHKYDTLALEASYLAHGQAMRVQESEKEIRRFRELHLPESPDKVVLGTLVTLVDLDDNRKQFFVAPCEGGMKVQFENQTITLVTFESPLGKAIKGTQVGDEVRYQAGDNTYYYEIETISWHCVLAIWYGVGEWTGQDDKNEKNTITTTITAFKPSDGGAV